MRPRGAYSLEESAGFIDAWHEAPSEGGAGRAQGAISGKTEGHLHLAFLTDRDWRPVGVCLRQDEGGDIHGTVYGEASAAEVSAQTARILSLDVDGTGWPEVGRRDPVVGRLQKLFPGFRPVNWSNAYEATAWCLISTRISMRQGQGIKERMCRELGAAADIHGHRLFNFPGPEVLAELKSFNGLFGRKLEYLNALGRAALAGELDTQTLREMPRHQALEHLKRLPGIGEFGSQLVRLRALSAVDELPTAEPRLLEAVRIGYDLRSTPAIEELADIAEKWRPFRMWVAVSFRRSMAGGTGITHSRAAG